MEIERTFAEAIVEIQNKINVPKNKWNEFGKYYYRSAEDIWTAVKPVLSKYKILIVASDRVENIGKYNYQVCKLTVTNIADPEEHFFVEGWAREDDSRKGMDSPQMSGSASSYAAKRAWGNLLGLDDCKDSDATNKHGKEEDNFIELPIDDDGITKSDIIVQQSALKRLLEDTGFSNLEKEYVLFLQNKGMVNVKNFDTLNYDQASLVIKHFGELAAEFFANRNKHESLIDIFKLIKNKEDKVKLLGYMDMMIPEITNPVEYDKMPDGALNDYFRLYLLTIHNNEANKITEQTDSKILTADEAIAEMERLGMEPIVKERIAPRKEKKQKEIDDEFL